MLCSLHLLKRSEVLFLRVDLCAGGLLAGTWATVHRGRRRLEVERQSEDAEIPVWVDGCDILGEEGLGHNLLAEAERLCHSSDYCAEVGDLGCSLLRHPADYMSPGLVDHIAVSLLVRSHCILDCHSFGLAEGSKSHMHLAQQDLLSHIDRPGVALDYFPEEEVVEVCCNYGRLV